MQIDSETLDHGILKVSLSGRMDIPGVQTIDTKFTELTATQRAFVLVDITEVSFLTSLGVRIMLSSAKALLNHDGHMVLYNPQPIVLDVLKSMGVSSLIPHYDKLENALNDLIARQTG